jgi:16S rRNA (guanine527-N7)-methyltransferase
MSDQEAEWLDRCLAIWNVRLPATALQQQLEFLDSLQHWNRRINLTAITDRREGLEKHLLDSLSVLPLLQGDEKVLDLGSGAGLPGIPLKIANSKMQLWSVDAVQKKIAFQRQVARLLSLTDFHPIHARMEELIQDENWLGHFDVVVARAVSSLPALLGWGLPLLRPGGRLIAMKGPEWEAELHAASEALKAMRVQCTEQRRLRLPESGAARTLLVFTHL